MTVAQTVPTDSGRAVQSGIYLYGCTLAPFAESMESACPLPTAQWLKSDDLAAVFAKVSLDDFGQDNLQDPAWLVPRALQHEEVIEALMAQGPILPVRFGCLFSSVQGLAGFLKEHGEIIRQFLQDMVAKEEWALKVYLDLKRASVWLAAADPELAERQRRLPASPGARYFQEKRLQAEVQQKTRHWGREAAQQLERALGFEHAAVRSLPLRGPEELKGDMILHQAVLLPRAAVADFHARLAELEARHAEQGLVLESSGPWPAYNFCPALGEPGP